MRSKMVLVLSLVMGVITTALFYQYMKQFDEKTTAAAPMAEIVIAKEKINKNEKITAEKLELVQVPKQSVLPQSVKSVSEAEGKLAESMIEKGEPVFTHRLVSRMDESIYVSRKVREGYRAVSVSVNLPQSVSNLIEAEDEVDVIFSKADKKAPDQPKVDSVLLLEKARVLAVGKKMVLPEDSKENPGDQGKEYTTVTLELKPEDAVKLVNSSEEGDIHFILLTRPVVTDDEQISNDTENES